MTLIFLVLPVHVTMQTLFCILGNFFQLVIKVFLFYCRVASPREEKNCRKMSIVEEFQFYYGQGEEVTIICNNEPQTLYT